MDYQVEQFIQIMEKLDKAARQASLPKIKPEIGKNGLRASAVVNQEPETVYATPIMKNLLLMCGDVQETVGADGEKETTKLRVGEKSKAVEWMNAVVNAALLKFNGPERHDYPTDLPYSDPTYYDIDCWNGWKKEIWDIQPGQTKQVQEGYLDYSNPETNISVTSVIALIRKSPALQAAIKALLVELPEVQASHDITKISDPFMSKGTGVSYPDWKNDRTTVPGSTMTYGQYEIELARQAARRGIRGLVEFALENNVCTGYRRLQRGKGRPLIAMSRRNNLVVNCINSVELQLWKESCALRNAFVPEEELCAHLAYLGDWIEAHPRARAANLDYSKWDRNLGAGWIAFQNAARYMKAKDQYTRDLITVRHICNSKSLLVDGISRRIYPIFGRMFSGYDDTTLGNSTANLGISRGALCFGNPRHIRDYFVPLQGRDLTIVGDDVLAVGEQGFEHPFIKFVNDFCKTVLHEDEKHAQGLMFIQYRALKLDGKWVISYNWPRVLRSMLSKETAKHLGRGGWTFSEYQQLGKLRHYPKMCSIVLNIVAAIDPFHLSLDHSVEEIQGWVKEEDRLRVKEGEVNKKKKLARKNTTAEALFNANPNIPGILIRDDGNVEFDTNYFTKLQAELKAMYNPNFLKELGFSLPRVDSSSSKEE